MKTKNKISKRFAAVSLAVAVAAVSAAVVSNAGAGSTDRPATAAAAVHTNMNHGATPTAASVAVNSPSAVDPRSGGLEVALGEWSVGLEAKAIRPGRVTFVVTNRGKVVHGFEIEAAGDRRGDDDDDMELETGRLRAGQSARLTLDLAPGVYEVECFVGDHDDMGMVATLTVRADAPLVAATKAPTNTVQIKNFAFKPATLTAKAGATVRWRNVDAAPHTATANNRSFDSKILNRNGSYARRFARPGTYAYICALHPVMRGKIVVR